MTTSTDTLLINIAVGLAGRLRSLVMAMDRLDRLESGSGAWRSNFDQQELVEATTELSLRALRTATDPHNFALLQRLAGDDSHSLSQLIKESGFGRLILSEQLNDLVQVGLATRLIDTDHAQITVAGASVVRLVEALSSEMVARYENNQSSVNSKQ